MRETSGKDLKRRRSVVVALVTLVLLGFGLLPTISDNLSKTTETPKDVLSQTVQSGELAIVALDKLEVKGRAPKTGYSRSEYGNGWAVVLGCDMRNRMLQDGLVDEVLSDDGCVVLSGTLNDPYTGEVIDFVRGTTTSDDVQIDHVVALSDSWQKGAQGLSYEERVQLANDPLNLLAVDGGANQEKGDSDSASWLPPNKDFRCRYVARQVAVKLQYRLWVTEAEKSAIKRVLNGCEGQVLPDQS